MMKILVTGAQGMLGKDLHKELQPLGKLAAIDLRECDITDKSMCLSVISEIQPDVVIHAAAYTLVDDCETNRESAFRVNGDGAGNVAAACRDNNAWMIYYSSDYVFDGRTEQPYTETDKTNPLSVYGLSKLQGEDQIREILPSSHLILRTAWLFGVHGNNFIRTIINKSLEVDRLRIINDQTGCPTYTRDLAKATKNLIQKSARGILNVTNQGMTSWHGFASYFLAKVNSNVEVQPISTNEYPLPARRPAFSVLSTDKLRKEYEIRLPSWKNAVDRYLDENGTNT